MTQHEYNLAFLAGMLATVAAGLAGLLLGELANLAFLGHL